MKGDPVSVQDLLDASRVESGQLTLTPARIATATLLSESMNTLRPLVEAVENACRRDLPAIRKLAADPGA